MNCIAFFDGTMSGIKGSVKFHQCDRKTPTNIVIELEGFKDDKPRGIHIHTYGDLSQGCKSACDHYNPYEKLHGNYIIHGNDRHVGDLINNIIPKRGKVYVEYTDPLVNLFGKHSILGRMVVIHGGEDDMGLFRDTDKGSSTTGNAGDRIACAVIGLSSNKHF